jgi:hypothetical protein
VNRAAEVRVLCPTCGDRAASVFVAANGTPMIQSGNLRQGRTEGTGMSLALSIRTDGPLPARNRTHCYCLRAGCPGFTISNDEALALLARARPGRPYRWTPARHHTDAP